MWIDVKKGNGRKFEGKSEALNIAGFFENLMWTPTQQLYEKKFKCSLM